MRVRHVHWTALPVTGGVEVHCAAVVRQLAALGVDAELLSGTPAAHAGRRFGALQLGVVPDEEQLAELVAELATADVVHWHNPQWHKPEVVTEVVAGLRARRWPGELVLDLHNIDDLAPHWAFLRGLSDRYVAHSPFVAEELRAHLPGVRVELLPLAMDRRPEPYELPGTGRFRVLQPTRLTTWKGSDLSLRAAVTLLEEGEDVSFVHAGTKHLVWPANIPGELMAAVEPWQERGRVSFVAYSPEQSWSAIAAADLVLHPTADRGTHGEPFSLSVAQAVICGRPVIASESGHLPALLAGYSAGRLVPPGDQEALTEAVLAALRDPAPVLSDADLALGERLAAEFAGAGQAHLEFYRADVPQPQPVHERTPMPVPIILDCDPGHDDAFAILFAAGSEDIDLRAVTTIAGNQALDKVTRNARHVLGLAGATGVPVAAGCEQALLGEAASRGLDDRFTGPDVHGETGLDGWDFGEPAVPLDGRTAVDLMRDVLAESAEPVTIVCTGPQTNLAALLIAAPHLKQKIGGIVCMGGSSQRGNFLPYSEANVLFDPEAAAVVLASGLPISYVGLNVTHQALVTAEVIDQIAEVPRIGEAAAALLRFRSSTYDRIWGLPDAPLHDPVAVALLIAPSLFRCQEANVEVELHGTFTRGATAIDLAGVTSRAPNALVALDVDVPEFWKLLISTLWRLA